MKLEKIAEMLASGSYQQNYAFINNAPRKEMSGFKQRMKFKKYCKPTKK